MGGPTEHRATVHRGLAEATRRATAIRVRCVARLRDPQALGLRQLAYETSVLMTSHALSADPSATVCRLSQSEPRPATCQLDLSGLRGGLVLGTASQHQCTTLPVPGSGHAPRSARPRTQHGPRATRQER